MKKLLFSLLLSVVYSQRRNSLQRDVLQRYGQPQTTKDGFQIDFSGPVSDWLTLHEAKSY